MHKYLCQAQAAFSIMSRMIDMTEYSHAIYKGKCNDKF